MKIQLLYLKKTRKPKPNLRCVLLRKAPTMKARFTIEAGSNDYSQLTTSQQALLKDKKKCTNGGKVFGSVKANGKVSPVIGVHVKGEQT